MSGTFALAIPPNLPLQLKDPKIKHCTRHCGGALQSFQAFKEREFSFSKKSKSVRLVKTKLAFVGLVHKLWDGRSRIIFLCE